MGAQTRPDYQLGVARVAGPTGVIAWREGVITKNGLTRLSAGVYQFDLFPSANPNEVSLDVTPIMAEPRDFTWAAEWITTKRVILRTATGGAPFDFDFSIEINRHRNALSTDVIPPPAPLPPASSSSGPAVALSTVQPLPGVDTALVTLQVLDGAGNPLTVAALLQLEIADDITGVIPGVGTLDTPTAGAIVLGLATNALVIQTDATGLFACSAHNVFLTPQYLLAALTFGSPALDCQSVASILFAP